jgi:hypothetical protein
VTPLSPVLKSFTQRNQNNVQRTYMLLRNYSQL